MAERDLTFSGMRRWRAALRTSILCAVGLGCTAAAAPMAAQASPRELRVGSVPSLPAGLTPVASAASASGLLLTVTLKPSDAAALSAYATAVANPASPLYHRYLSVAAFRRRFTPSAAVLRKLEASLRAHGLRSFTVTANGLAIEVRTTTAAAERAFSLTLAHVRTRTGKDVIYNVQAPAFDASVAHSVQAVVGLDGFSQVTREPELRSASKSAVATRTAAGTATPIDTGGAEPTTSCESAIAGTSTKAISGGYTTDQIATAYSFASVYQAGDLGAGTTVALYELEPNLASDISTYESCYGLTTNVNYVKVDGGAQTTSNGDAGLGEAALDIEQVVGLAPKANVLVYQGPNSSSSGGGSGPYDTYAQIISQNRASVISTSWGECEAEMGTNALVSEYVLFEEAAIQGQTIVAAAGDSGAEDCYDATTGTGTGLAVDDPASQPLVTGVGGTSLTAIGPAPTETVWNDGAANGGGGGGVSNVWLMAAAQRQAASTLGVINGNSSKSACASSTYYCREVPDVAAGADQNHGYLVYYSGDYVSSPDGFTGWQAVGGTSAAAPVWAALVALANAEPTCKSRVGMINGELYALAASSQSKYFNDVTSGNNDILGDHDGHYPASTGYDMATGLGSPIASALVPALCSGELILNSPGDRYSFRFAKTRLTLSATLLSGANTTVTYKASKLPKGLTLNAATGVISGSPQNLGVTHVTVLAQTGNQVLSAVQFKWTVSARPKVSSAKLTAANTSSPRLSLSVVAGTDEPGFTALAVTLPSALAATSDTAAIHVYGGGQRLNDTVAVSGARVTVTLTARQRQLTVVFGSGSLKSTSALRVALRKSGVVNLQLAVTPVDAAGQSVALARTLKL